MVVTFSQSEFKFLSLQSYIGSATKTSVAFSLNSALKFLACWWHEQKRNGGEEIKVNCCFRLEMGLSMKGVQISLFFLVYTPCVHMYVCVYMLRNACDAVRYSTRKMMAVHNHWSSVQRLIMLKSRMDLNSVLVYADPCPDTRPRCVHTKMRSVFFCLAKSWSWGCTVFSESPVGILIILV